ncbi:MAG: GNAT family N-acetyltransferase [Verrucomicrobia bacterium]|nr:GNAT family N-acetyltransferase [Verrucomicrobiota bacterium]
MSEPAELPVPVPDTVIAAAEATGAHLFPIVRAVLIGQLDGQAFALSPASLVAASASGFMQYAGNRENDLVGLQKLLGAGGRWAGRYLLWYQPPDFAVRWLDALRPTNANIRLRTRIRYIHGGLEPAVATRGGDHPPSRLARVDATVLAGLWQDADFAALGRFWRTPSQFLREGLGVYAATPEGHVVSLCYAACVAEGVAEIDILTRASACGQGFATACLRQFLAECHQAGFDPSWDCFDANTASMRLAKSAGFVETMRYPFYSFNTPLSS